MRGCLNVLVCMVHICIMCVRERGKMCERERERKKMFVCVREKE
jgi:hypothetical protein